MERLMCDECLQWKEKGIFVLPAWTRADARSYYDYDYEYCGEDDNIIASIKEIEAANYYLGEGPYYLCEECREKYITVPAEDKDVPGPAGAEYVTEKPDEMGRRYWLLRH